MEELRERFGGLDWANDSHAVNVVDDEGTMIDEFEVPDSSDGLGDMCRRLKKAAVRRVAIERPDGPVVDALLEAGLEVVVVVSRSVKALRVRYGASGNKSDRADAYVLADCLRTDGHRWQSLQPDTPATVTLRSHVRARKDLVEHRVAIANQLRAHLKVVFPGPVGLFSDLDSPISLAFLRRFPWEGKRLKLCKIRRDGWLRQQNRGNVSADHRLVEWNASDPRYMIPVQVSRLCKDRVRQIFAVFHSGGAALDECMRDAPHNDSLVRSPRRHPGHIIGCRVKAPRRLVVEPADVVVCAPLWQGITSI